MPRPASCTSLDPGASPGPPPVSRDVRGSRIELVDGQLSAADLEWLLVGAGERHFTQHHVAIANHGRRRGRLAAELHLDLNSIRIDVERLLRRFGPGRQTELGR